MQILRTLLCLLALLVMTIVPALAKCDEPNCTGTHVYTGADATGEYTHAESSFDPAELVLAERLAYYMQTDQGKLARAIASPTKLVTKPNGTTETYRGLGINLDGRVGNSPPLWRIIRDNAAYYRGSPEQLLRHMRAPRAYFTQYASAAKYQVTAGPTLGLKPIYDLPKSKTGTYSSYIATDGRTVYVIDDHQFVQTRLPIGDVWVAYSPPGHQRT